MLLDKPAVLLCDMAAAVAIESCEEKEEEILINMSDVNNGGRLQTIHAVIDRSRLRHRVSTICSTRLSQFTALHSAVYWTQVETLLRAKRICCHLNATCHFLDQVKQCHGSKDTMRRGKALNSQSCGQPSRGHSPSCKQNIIHFEAQMGNVIAEKRTKRSMGQEL